MPKDLHGREFGRESSHFISGLVRTKICRTSITKEVQSTNKLKTAFQGYQNVDHPKIT